VIGFAIFVQGMGEPLNNYKAVVEGTRIMTGRCFGLSPTHITISTVRSLLHLPYYLFFRVVCGTEVYFLPSVYFRHDKEPFVKDVCYGTLVLGL